MTGQAENAEMAAGHVAALERLPVEIVTATALFSDGELVPAEAMTRAYLLKHGNHIEAMRLLARIGLAHDVLDDADILLEAVLELAPDYRAARYDYAIALLRRHKHSQAVAELEKLLQLEPANRVYRTSYATANVGLGEHERALALYRELLVDAPPGAHAGELHLSVAHSLKALGRQPEAIDAYRAAAAARPRYGDAYWSLANLKTYRFPEDEISRMRADEAADGTSLVDRFHLCFALGKAFEDRGDYAESFRYYERGNALKKSQTRYRPEPVERNTRLQKSICTREFFAARRDCRLAGSLAHLHSRLAPVGIDAAGADPCFAFESRGHDGAGGYPANGAGTAGAGTGGRQPALPSSARGADPGRFFTSRREIHRRHRVYRTDKPLFIDKMPNNFRHIGLIHLILPNAKIIDARRNALACCFSNFKQLFASGQDFTYGLEDIGRYYRTYVELMAHWDSVLPGRILRVEHEAVVDDLESNVRRILEFCGLEFEPQCVEFYKTERSIRTASSEQVRQPIFKEGIDQWRNFEPWLGPLKEALGPLAS